MSGPLGLCRVLGRQWTHSACIIKGNEVIRIESVGSFVQRFTSDREIAKENLQKAVGLQLDY